MGRRIGSFGAALLVASACVLPNPAFDEGGASEAGNGASQSESSASGASQSASGGSEASATSTSGSGSASASASTGTASSDPSAPSTGPTATSDDPSSGSSGDPTTGGPPNGACPIGQVAIQTEYKVAQADTMVVKPGDGMTCAWNAMCGDLNYGAASYVDLVNSAADGRSLFLARFDLSDYSKTLDGLGIDADTVIGFRVRVLVWESQGSPSEVWTFQVATIAPENQAWRGGDKFGTPAIGSEVSFKCLSSEGGCVPWLADGPLGGATNVATLKVTAEAASEGEEENPDDPGTYHAHVLSSPIPIEAVASWLDAVVNPGFVIYLVNPKSLDNPTSLGLKPLEEVMFSGTRIFVEHCVPMR